LFTGGVSAPPLFGGSMQKAWIVVPAGYGYSGETTSDEFKVCGFTEVYLGESLSAQLINIPLGINTIGIITPDDMPDKDHFRNMVNIAWCGLQTTRNTIKNLYPKWLKTSHQNFEHLSKVKPVDQIRKKPGKAVLCANGPSLLSSLKKLKGREDLAVFACWHSAHKVQEAGLNVDYVCHTDNAVPNVDFKKVSFPFDTVFIASPKAAPEFVSLSKFYETYLYLPLDVPIISSIYSEALGCQEHDPIVSTVASMLVNTAIYAGYDELIFAGVDNGWVSEDEAYPECTEAVEIENQYGVKVQTYGPFALAALGIENKLRRHPDIKVYQLTQNALDIAGVQYLEDL
jgi:hypothetical protein